MRWPGILLPMAAGYDILDAAGNLFAEKQGYSLRTNLNYRNKSLNEKIPTGK